MAKFEEFVKSRGNNDTEGIGTNGWSESESPKVRLTGEDLDAIEKIFATAFTVGVEQRDRVLQDAIQVKKKLYGVLLGKTERELQRGVYDNMSDGFLFRELADTIKE